MLLYGYYYTVPVSFKAGFSIAPRHKGWDKKRSVLLADYNVYNYYIWIFSFEYFRITRVFNIYFPTLNAPMRPCVSARQLNF